MRAWPIKLPVFEPDVYDNSMMETHSRCPRLFLYEYGLRRGPLGSNYPIKFGVAYHKYREIVENVMREEEVSISPDVHAIGVEAAFTDWSDPPFGHKKEYLNAVRLQESLDLAYTRIETEQAQGAIQVIRAEDAFDLSLPHGTCPHCGEMVISESETDCPNCGVPFSLERFGGRIDQIISWHGKLWIRDFKTTSRMGKTYPQKFDPNNQMTGYVWAGSELSGRPVKGVLIETVYNTKTKGPEIKQFMTQRSPGQIEQWIGTTFFEIADLRRAFKNIDDLGYLAFPQRTDTCDDYGGCYYREACARDSAWEIENWLENNTEYSEWDFTDPDKENSENVA